MNDTQLHSVRMIADTCKTQIDEWEKEKTAKQRSSEKDSPKDNRGIFNFFDSGRHIRRQVSRLCLHFILLFH